jgi:predicted transcriptional regulator
MENNKTKGLTMQGETMDKKRRKFETSISHVAKSMACVREAIHRLEGEISPILKGREPTAEEATKCVSETEFDNFICSVCDELSDIARVINSISDRSCL